MRQCDMKTWVLLVICSGGLAFAAEPVIEFNPQPEAGIPPEALEQRTGEMKVEPGLTLPKLVQDAIEKVQVRYANPKVWTDRQHADVKNYLSRLLSSESSSCYAFQIWSQSVGIPEIDCLIEFNQAYLQRLPAEKKFSRVGRLIIWKTEACYRDGTGRWWYVSNYDNYHRWHPDKK